MSSAGFQLLAGRIPGERIATTVVSSDSSTFTSTEVSLATVVAPVVAGRTYRVRAVGQFGSTVSNDRVSPRIRQDSVAGSEMVGTNIDITAGGITFGWPFDIEAEFTAGTTENKTFVLTGDRSSGSGNCHLEAASTRPTFLYVDYIRG